MGDPAVIVWSTQIAWPAEGRFVDETWTAAQDYVAGAPILFHISNHGENTWSLTELTATYPKP